MKSFFTLALIFNSLFCFSQTCINGVWTWMRGDSLLSNKKIFGSPGTLNAADPNNDPSGRYILRSLTNGKEVFVYGGVGFLNNPNTGGAISPLNDLWKFEIGKNVWTRLWGSVTTPEQYPVYGTKGQFSAANNPGFRSEMSMALDGSDNIWLFGGIRMVNINEGAYPSGQAPTNELWMYDTKKGQWAWMYGSNIAADKGTYINKGNFDPNAAPCNRYSAFTWFDKQGNFWLFGGFARDAALNPGRYLNDVWKFDFQKKQWCWVHGEAPDFTYSNGAVYAPNIVFGKQNQEEISNTPGTRTSYQSAYWVDAQGNLILFGGREGYYQDLRNDLWKFDVNSQKWTFLHGDQDIFQYSIYGKQNSFDKLNVPSARTQPIPVGIYDDKLFMYGGYGLARVNEVVTGFGNFGQLSDLWVYDLKTSSWAWIKGDTIGIQPPVYGTKGKADDLNHPGAREGGYGFVFNDSAYLFGGRIRYKKGSQVIMNPVNDVWRLELKPTSLKIYGVNVIKIQNDNLIEWKAVTSGNVQFIIQKSYDKKNFTNVTGVSALSSGTEQKYSFLEKDAWKSDSTLYYRILTDGGQTCSVYGDTIAVKYTAEDMWIAPNPGSSKVGVYILSAVNDTATIRLISLLGITLQYKTGMVTPGLNIFPFDVQRYAAAGYFLEVRLKKRYKTFKFIKHN